MAGSNEIILKKKQKKHSINQWSCYHLGATRRCVEENERQTNKQTKNKWKLGKKASKKWKLKLGRVRNRFARYLVSVLVGFYHQTLRCHSVIFNRSFFFYKFISNKIIKTITVAAAYWSALFDGPPFRYLSINEREMEYRWRVASGRSPLPSPSYRFRSISVSGYRSIATRRNRSLFCFEIRMDSSPADCSLFFSFFKWLPSSPAAENRPVTTATILFGGRLNLISVF